MSEATPVATGETLRVDVVLDDRWLLPLPDALVDADAGAQRQWAEAALAARAEGSAVDPEEREARIVALVESFALQTAGAVLAARTMRDGAPGAVLVHVLASGTAAASVDELDEDVEAALPQQVLPLELPWATSSRTVSTVRQSPVAGAVGFLQLQGIAHGALVEVVAASPDLAELGGSLDLLEELARRIEVAPGPAPADSTS